MVDANWHLKRIFFRHIIWCDIFKMDHRKVSCKDSLTVSEWDLVVGFCEQDSVTTQNFFITWVIVTAQWKSSACPVYTYNKDATWTLTLLFFSSLWKFRGGFCFVDPWYFIVSDCSFAFQFSLKLMLEHLELSFEGRPHSGLDDARNIARVLIRMIYDGASIQVNERIHLLALEAKSKMSSQVGI